MSEDDAPLTHRQNLMEASHINTDKLYCIKIPKLDYRRDSSSLEQPVSSVILRIEATSQCDLPRAGLC